MDVDLDAAYEAYLERFKERFGERPDGAFVKFEKHMVQKLRRDEYPGRMNRYLELHAACRQMLKSGATINDAVVLEFDEAAAWLAIQAPDMMAMFGGEMGDPDVATGAARSTLTGGS